MTDKPSNNGRKTDGTFATGNKEGKGRPDGSRNKASKGRPDGSRNKASLMAEKLMEGDTEEVIMAVIEKAKDGDIQAAKLILDRIVPLRKGRPVQIDLPGMTNAGDVVNALSATLKAVSDGHLTPDEAQALAHILEGQRRAIETTDLERRLETLEAHQ
jgi:hypothetical protein